MPSQTPTPSTTPSPPRNPAKKEENRKKERIGGEEGWTFSNFQTRKPRFVFSSYRKKNRAKWGRRGEGPKVRSDQISPRYLKIKPSRAMPALPCQPLSSFPMSNEKNGMEPRYGLRFYE